MSKRQIKLPNILFTISVSNLFSRINPIGVHRFLSRITFGSDILIRLSLHTCNLFLSSIMTFSNLFIGLSLHLRNIFLSLNLILFEHCTNNRLYHL